MLVMNSSVSCFDLDGSEENNQIPTYEELLKEYPGLGVHVADEIVYFATQLEHYDPKAAIHLIQRAMEIITTHDLTWDQLKWRWMMDAVSEAYLRSKRHERQIQSLFTRLERVENKSKASASDTVSSPLNRASSSLHGSPSVSRTSSEVPVPPPYISKQTKTQGK
jgi:hypothetical protein